MQYVQTVWYYVHVCSHTCTLYMCTCTMFAMMCTVGVEATSCHQYAEDDLPNAKVHYNYTHVHVYNIPTPK